MTSTQEIPPPEEIRERLAPVFRREGLRLVLLFGSTASGKAHRRSDIDIAFLFDGPIDILSLTNEVIGLLRTDNVDVIDLRRASPLLKFAAAKGGKLLYEKVPGIFNEFYSLAFRVYIDAEKLRLARTESIRNFLEARGTLSPLDEEIIRRKLSIIMENLNALESVKGISIEEYAGDLFKRKAVERLLQELIEAAIDINVHIIAQSGSAVPDDYFESFIKAGELKILSMDLSEMLAPSAGLRNRLVHEYDRLEHSLVLDAVRMAEDLFPKYMKQIEDYISG